MNIPDKTAVFIFPSKYVTTRQKKPSVILIRIYLHKKVKFRYETNTKHTKPQ